MISDETKNTCAMIFSGGVAFGAMNTGLAPNTASTFGGFLPVGAFFAAYARPPSFRECLIGAGMLALSATIEATTNYYRFGFKGLGS